MGVRPLNKANRLNGEAVGGYHTAKKPGTTKKNYTGSKSYTAGSDVKVIKADGTVEWVPSKKKLVKNYGEVKFSEKSE